MRIHISVSARRDEETLDSAATLAKLKNLGVNVSHGETPGELWLTFGGTITEDYLTAIAVLVKQPD
jgi:hypothetical protein